MSRDRIDWSQLWYPGPRRSFTAAELARAGTDQPGRTLITMLLINVAILAFAWLQIAPAAATAVLTGVLAAAAVGAFMLGKRLWQNPTRRRLAAGTLIFVFGCGLGAGLTRSRASDELARQWLFYSCWALALLATIGLWFLAVYRADQIAARLRELDERERVADMASQLAAAQIQPHFLFNSLASLQHWVQVKDDRAAALLDSLTAYLRDTLPLFNLRMLRLGDEAQAVRRYLEVMQLRLGQRLRFVIDIEPAAAAAQIPPGLLLTLVENAIEHGVQASLHGAEVRLSARALPEARLQIEVHDTGPGPGPGLAPDSDSLSVSVSDSVSVSTSDATAATTPGVGLANSRTRLRQAFGAAASLTLRAAPAGGCIARIEMPLLNTLTTP